MIDDWMTLVKWVSRSISHAHRACMLTVGAAIQDSMVGKQYDQADEQERASVRPFAEYAGVQPSRRAEAALEG